MLPEDSELYLQIVIEDTIYIQTVPTKSNDGAKSWTIRVNCHVPIAEHVVLVTIRTSPSRGMRVLSALVIQSQNSTRFAMTKSSYAPTLSLEILPFFEIIDSPKGLSKVVNIRVPRDHISSTVMNQHDMLSRIKALAAMPNAAEIDSLELDVLYERVTTLPTCQTKLQSLHELGFIHSRRYSYYDRNQAILAFEDALEPGASSPAFQALVLGNLGVSYDERFLFSNDLDDLLNARERKREALLMIPEGSHECAMMSDNLGNTLLRLHEVSGETSYIEEAVTSFEWAVDFISPNHYRRQITMGNLGMALCRRFEALGKRDDIDRAITLLEEVVCSNTQSSDPDHHTLISALGNCYSIRFERFGNVEDIGQGVKWIREAVAIVPNNIPNARSYRNELASVLKLRFNVMGNVEDITEAVTIARNCLAEVAEPSALKPDLLQNFAQIFLTHSSMTNSKSEAQEALALAEQAVTSTTEKGLARTTRLHTLSHVLFQLNEELNDPQFLQRAMVICQEVDDASRHYAPHLIPEVHHDFGSALLRRYEVSGNIHDLDASINRLTLAVDTGAAIHDVQQPARMHNLSVALYVRFNHYGGMDDLDYAMSLMEAVVQQLPEKGRSQAGGLLEYSSLLITRFHRGGNLQDLNNSLKYCRKALQASHRPTERLVITSNLVVVLAERFTRLEQVSDLDEAITLSQSVLDGIGPQHPRRPLYLKNHASALSCRFKLDVDIQHLNLGIVMLHEALELLSADNPQSPATMVQLGDMLLERYAASGVDGEDRNQALQYFGMAAFSQTGSPSSRFHAAAGLATQYYYSLTDETEARLRGYATAMGLLPELVWLGLSIGDRQFHLAEAGAVVRDAAAAAIQAGQLDLAMEWLEQGRSVVYAQLLQLRSPVDELEKIRPDLAQRLVNLSKQLDDNANDGPQSLSVWSDTKSLAPHSTAVPQKFSVALDRDQVLQEIRSLDGFQDFLRPKKPQELLRAADHGPVVIINISERGGCDALILRPRRSDVLHLHLEDMTLEEARGLRASLSQLLVASGRSTTRDHISQEVVQRLKARRPTEKHESGPVEEFKKILGRLWDAVVKPVIDMLGLTPNDQPLPRIWWCLAGPLAFLPMHAAGIYGSGPTSSKLSDYAVSSYTPTLSALINSFQSHIHHDPEPHLLCIAQAHTPGQAALPEARQELDKISAHVPSSSSITRLEDAAADVRSVREAMKTANWVHFACHGLQDVTKPTESALILSDGILSLAEIMKLSLPRADLAVLSACQTATGAEGLEDESVHIAAGMLSAGYRGVVATMWSIRDVDAPKIADVLYRDLFSNLNSDHHAQGHVDRSSGAAKALHSAVANLQASGGQDGEDFLSWVPFIHLGY